jgi:lipoprotein-anchoring transpeptidase ErfK/SrfK
MKSDSRRSFLKMSACALPAALLGACTPAGQSSSGLLDLGAGRFHALYGPKPNETHPMEALDLSEIDERLLRQEVAFSGSEPRGTIVVDVGARYLYLVTGANRALRYGVGVGKAGYEYRGEAIIGRKASWPGWTPTPSMISDNPAKNRPWAGGMPGGIDNPLGARALYLHRDGVDTMYRIHGTNEPWSIGSPVSSGCVRMLNHDVIDLFERVPLGARVIVRNVGRAPERARVAQTEQPAL